MRRPSRDALLTAVELLVARGILHREPDGSLTAGDGVPTPPLDVASVFRWPAIHSRGGGATS